MQAWCGCLWVPISFRARPFLFDQNEMCLRTYALFGLNFLPSVLPSPLEGCLFVSSATSSPTLGCLKFEVLYFIAISPGVWIYYFHRCPACVMLHCSSLNLGGLSGEAWLTGFDIMKTWQNIMQLWCFYFICTFPNIPVRFLTLTVAARFLFRHCNYSSFLNMTSLFYIDRNKFARSYLPVGWITEY